MREEEPVGRKYDKDIRSRLDALRDRERALNALNMVEGVSGCPLVFLH